MPKVKLTNTHDRLAIKAEYEDGTLKYSTSRSGDRMSIENPRTQGIPPINKQQLQKLFVRFNKFENEGETNLDRFNRAVEFLKGCKSLSEVAKSAA